MTQVLRVPIANFLEFGEANGGTALTMKIKTESGDEFVLVFPSNLGPGVITHLMAAVGMAHRKTVARLGSEQAAVDHLGVAPFMPTDFEIGSGISAAGGGEELVLLRLKKDRVPIVDVMMTREGAAAIGGELTQLAASPLAPRPMQ